MDVTCGYVIQQSLATVPRARPRPAAGSKSPAAPIPQQQRRLSGLAQAGEVKPAVKTAEAVDALITDLRDGLAAFVAAFDDRAMPYRSRPRPEFAPRYSDYDHLARVREWSAGPGEDEMIAVVPR